MPVPSNPSARTASSHCRSTERVFTQHASREVYKDDGGNAVTSPARSPKPAAGSHWTVSADEAGVRLDKFLAGADRLGSRSRAAAALERGKIFVNDEEASTADAARRLSTRDRVRVWMDRPGSSKRRSALHRTADLDILYEDDDLIAVSSDIAHDAEFDDRNHRHLGVRDQAQCAPDIRNRRRSVRDRSSP